jgi:glutamate N-acetyltransferase/amino-acid N-acetyltransferase
VIPCLLLHVVEPQIPGGVTAAAGFQAAGMYGGLRAAGRKPDLALVVCDTDAVSAGGWVLFSSYQVSCSLLKYSKLSSKKICSLLP